CPNPERDTDRSLTQFLLGDFRGHLDAAPPLPALDYLQGAFEQLLDLPAWTIAEPPEALLPAADDPRPLMVTGRRVPRDLLYPVVDAAEKLLAEALPGWASPAGAQPVSSGQAESPVDRDAPETTSGTVSKERRKRSTQRA